MAHVEEGCLFAFALRVARARGACAGRDKRLGSGRFVGPRRSTGLRVLGRGAGLRGQAGVITWQRQRRLGAGEYAADVVTLRLPKATGSYRLVVTVHDDVAGTSATAERGLTLVK